MSKPTPETIMADARKLRDDRFAARNTMLKARADERFNRTLIEVPPAYKKTSQQHSSNIISDEGRQVGTLVHAVPVPHLSPLVPEDQPLTTKVEQFLSASLQQLEGHYGPVNWQCTSAQVHDNLAWIFTAPKRKPYKGQPKAPKDDADFGEQTDYDMKNDRFKRDAGISSVFDYEYASTPTVFYDGNVYNPNCVYIYKQVPKSTFKKTYGEMENVTGRPEGDSAVETMITVVEYWDREHCVIVAETTDMKWLGRKEVRGATELDSWTHNWGRVPYFARPCFVSEQIDEDKRFEGPLDGIYNEMPEHKRLRTMGTSIAYQTAFAPLKLLTKEQGESIVDDEGKPVSFLELEPGKARQLAPGQDVMPIGQSPEIANFYAEMAASQQRLERYLLSPVSKGISPGADTANSALSNLHRFQLSSLDPMAQQAARQWSAIFRFWLERIRDMGETVYAFNSKTDQYVSLNGQEIVSVNVQAKATPDQGQFQLLIEKHAMELWQVGAITELEMHEMRGKENPEEYVIANQVERLRKTLDPIILQQVVASLGMMDAVNAMIDQNAQTGDARNAVPGLMGQAQGMQSGQAPTGMGTGAPGQPRDQNAGVRASTTDVNTAPAGY